MKVTVKAEKKESILDAAMDFLTNWASPNSKIKRIRVKGKLNNNDILIDTNRIIKKEYIEVQRNEDTGEINTTEIFSQLLELSDQY